jgi:cytochrome b
MRRPRRLAPERRFRNEPEGAPMPEDHHDRVDVPVWDWPVRVVHWMIVLLVATLVTTGLAKGDAVMAWHMRAGETLLALVLFRVIWGFVGSRNARFASFVRGPAAVVAYVRSIVRPPQHAHATHNPIGGWMVVALLLALLGQASLGLFTNDDVLVDGPLVKLIDKDLSDALSSLHRRGWRVVAGLASLHVAAVISYFVALDENLVTPMISGVKSLPSALDRPEAASASTSRALVLLVLCGLAVWWTVNRL